MIWELEKSYGNDVESKGMKFMNRWSDEDMFCFYIVGWKFCKKGVRKFCKFIEGNLGIIVKFFYFFFRRNKKKVILRLGNL